MSSNLHHPQDAQMVALEDDSAIRAMIGDAFEKQGIRIGLVTRPKELRGVLIWQHIDPEAEAPEMRAILGNLCKTLQRSIDEDIALGAATPPIRFAGWELDPRTYIVRDAQRRKLDLTSGEFRLLHTLACRAGEITSRETLRSLIYGGDKSVFDRAIDVSVSRLRAKLLRHGGGELIRTVRGEGYLFAEYTT